MINMLIFKSSTLCTSSVDNFVDFLGKAIEKARFIMCNQVAYFLSMLKR